MTVLPFRRPKKKMPKPEADSEPSVPDHCSGCGWKLPASMSADPARVGQRTGDTFILYITCPECGVNLVVPVTFR